jgi:putative transcriptional regulator
MGQITLRVNDLLKKHELAEGRRLALADVARESGVPLETLAELAAGRADSVSLIVLAKLCDYLQCTPGALLVYDDDNAAAIPDEVESRDIVARWENAYGADEHPPEHLPD